MERDNGERQTFTLSTDFNSHAHVERDGKTDEIADILVNFNSHAHVERDENLS